MSPWWYAGAAAALGYVVAVVWGRAGWPKVLPALLLGVAVAPVSPVGALAFGFCALGDGLLLDKERYFLHGLAAFLVGHLLFVPVFIGRAAGAPPAWLAVAMGVLAVGVLGVVVPRLKGVLRVAVPVYALALAAMVVSAGALGPVAAAGALSFAVSDSTLAVNRFVKPLRRADLVVMVTYYAALLAIAASFS